MPRADIDLAALRGNVDVLQSRLGPGTRMLAAVKADGYGHGAVEVARHLSDLGVDGFGVATGREALELRRAGVTGRILIFGPVFEHIPELVEQGVALTITDPAGLAAVTASQSPEPARVHLKVDTGMGRLGLPWREALELARTLDRTPDLLFEGIWTHLARADEEDRTPTSIQLERFSALLGSLDRDGLRPPLAHVANSAGIVAYPESSFDMVRPGIALYGYHSSPVIAALEPRLRPVMTLTAPVTFVKRVRAGTPISYGGLWTAPRDTVVATVRIGYADGYPRLLSNGAWVRYGDRELPVVGRVCMDQLMIDAGTAGVGVGDRVTLFGPDGPDAEELASSIGTISYELLTSVSRRVERTYRS